MATIEDEIQQKTFNSNYQKAVINILYTASWLHGFNLRRLKPYGISPEQFNILRILRGQYPTPSTVLLLTERMLDKSSNASRIVEKLRLKGLVTRKEHQKDRRCVEVLITNQGLNLLTQIDASQTTWENQYHGITADEAQLLSELLDKFRG